MTLVTLGSELAVDKLAEMADRIMEMTTPSLAAMKKPSQLPVADAAEVNSLRAEDRHLQDLVQSMSVRPRESQQDFLGA